MNTRDQALDGLRGIAILLVLVGHLIEIQPTSALTGWLNQAIKSLWIGVDLFFVLSGYLITDILVRTRQDARRVRNFYMRRALRIFPAYYLIVIGTVLVVTAFHGDARIVADTVGFTPSLMVFMQNIVSAIDPARPMLREFTPLWSLAVEEQFYLLWPWLVWRCRTEQLPRLCLAVLGTALLLKAVMVFGGFKATAIYHLTFTRMDTLAVGAWLAARQATGAPPLPRWNWIVPFAAATLLAALFLYAFGLRMTRGALVVALATSATPWLFGGLLHASLVPGLLRRSLAHPWLTFFGRYSYGLYLVHFIADAGVRLWLKPLLPLAGNAAMLVVAGISLAGSVLLALLLHRLVEAPALRLKSRFDSPRSASVTAPLAVR